MNEIRDLIIGIDFGKEISQLCYYDRKAEEPDFVSMQVGAELYEIPTLLCRRLEQGDYCVGPAAEYFASRHGGILINELYEISGRKTPVQVADESREPYELVALYLRGMLKFLGVMDLVANT